jgi:class 3 adenylate cyclase/tetratricopeptide (TPR) repeat protein
MDRPPELDGSKVLSNLVRTTPPFVGRGQELAWLDGHLQDAMAGHPRVMLIQGEAGIGKTRLLQELRSGARRRGVQVGYGRCYEDLALPYLPLIEALRPLLEQGPEDVEHTLGSDAEVISRFLYRDGATRLAASPSASGQGNQDKLQLFLTVCRAVITLARHRPVLFVIDDLHWADRPSLDLFGHLVFTVADTATREQVSLLIVGTYRPIEPETPLARLVARFQRESICETTALPGFNESEIQELVKGLGLERPSHQLIATVSEATQGNPLFIQEVLHHLIQQQTLQERGGYLVTTASPADLRLPDQVTSAIVTRIQELSEGCRRALILASFMGDRFSLQPLDVVSGISEEELLNLLEEGVRQRLLLSEGQTFQFAHPLIRHVFYHEPSVARGQRIHRQIAQTLEHFYADNVNAHVLEIAHHLVRAGRVADVETVVKYARHAGDQAFKVFAWSEAAHYYEAALSAAKSAGRLSACDQAELHYLAGLAHYQNQDVGPCLNHYEEAIEAYRLIGDIPGLARALMQKTRTYYTLASAPYGSLIDMRSLEDVLSNLGESEPGLRGHITAVMAQAYRMAGQAAKAQEMAQRALEIGQSLADDRLCARASSALALAQINGLHSREALESWQRSLIFARRTNDLVLQGMPLQRMPLALIMLGRLDEAEVVALEACELTRKTQEWGEGYSVALSALASVAVARGDFEAAERYTYETMQMVSRSRYPWGGARALFALACTRALRGAWAEAEDALTLLVEPGRVFQEPGPIMQAFAQAFRQVLRAYLGTIDEAIEPFAMDLVKAVGTDNYSIAPLCALIELGDLMAAPAIAELPYQTLSLAVEQGMRFSSGWIFLIPRVLGVAATLQRRWDQAEPHFQTALESATSAGARPELARTYLDYARMLVMRGGKSDHHQAVELVRQAGPIFRKLGMEPFGRRTAQLAEALQDHVPLIPSQRATSLDHLNAQELEVLFQIVQGRTDWEIADDLVLSPQTLAGYVSTLLSKIGAENRMDAIAYAFEKGLTSRIPPQWRAKIPTTHDHPVGEEKAQSLRIILVTDMESSTAILERLGDAKAHEVFRIHNVIIRDCLRAHDGVEVTHTGDGIEAFFLSASSAVECAAAIQKAFVKHSHAHPNNPIHVRIGVHAGEAISTEGRLFGTAVHTTFRICTRARPGQILVSDVIQQLVTDRDFTFTNLGLVPLKGLTGRVRLYEVRREGESSMNIAVHG